MSTLRYEESDEKEIATHIVYLDDMPVFMGTIKEVAEYTGMTIGTLRTVISRTMNGERKGVKSYMIYPIDAEEEAKEPPKRVYNPLQEFIAYERKPDGNYYQCALGTVEQVALLLGISVKAVRSCYHHTKEGKFLKPKYKIYKVEELI